MKTLRGATLILMAALVFAGCSKTAGIEGKVTDGKGQPMSGVKMIAQQVQPIKGYEHFEVMTGTDGAVKFVGLFPSSGYIISPSSDAWTTDIQMTIRSGPERQTAMLEKPFVIRFMETRTGLILDSQTGLQWAVKDNGSNINWQDAKNYCANYRVGGHSDWRMPAIDELKGLYDGSINGNNGFHITKLITLTGLGPWASEMRASDAVTFRFDRGHEQWVPKSYASFISEFRILPVRTGR